MIPVIMKTDAEAYGNQFPPYREDPVRETLRAVNELETDAAYRQGYEDFQRRMVYGETVIYGAGIETLKALAASITGAPKRHGRKMVSPIP